MNRREELSSEVAAIFQARQESVPAAATMPELNREFAERAAGVLRERELRGRSADLTREELVAWGWLLGGSFRKLSRIFKIDHRTACKLITKGMPRIARKSPTLQRIVEGAKPWEVET